MDQRPLSTDGKYWYDGEKWNPVGQPAGAQPQSPRMRVRRSEWLTVGVVASLVVCFPIGLILTWLMPWSRQTKLIITGATALLVATLLIGVCVSPPPSTTRSP